MYIYKCIYMYVYIYYIYIYNIYIYNIYIFAFLNFAEFEPSGKWILVLNLSYPYFASLFRKILLHTQNRTHRSQQNPCRFQVYSDGNG